MTYRASKTYGHDVGLSVCFRQHRARSHCRFLHGYALSIHLEFEATELDHNGWVIDFGGLKDVRLFLHHTFDHRLLVAEDDPERDIFDAMDHAGVASVIFLPRVGCEAFAKYIFDRVQSWLDELGYSPRVTLHHVAVREHGANSAAYYG